MPDVNIPLKLQKGYKYVFEYIPPDASLKEQTWSLEIEGISFNKEYESHLKNLMLNDGIEHISKIKEGYLYPAPVIKTRVKNLETDEVYENVLSFQNKNSSHVCNGYDPMLYAIDKIPGFANSFFNESPDNKTIFYKMGTFSVNSDLILEFDKECPEKFFRWLYAQSTGGISPIKEANCWDKFKRWLKGS